VRVIQTGGVELDEFHVGHPAASAPGHGNSVTRGGVRVAGVQINLADAAGGQYGMAGTDSDNLIAGDVEHIGTKAAVLGLAELGGGNQVDCNVLLEHGDVWMFAHQVRQRSLHGAAGGIRCMQDAALTMAAFAGEMEAGCRIILGKRYAALDQPFHSITAVFDNETGGLRVA